MDVPPLKNGFERIDYDVNAPDGVRINVLITEDEPVSLLAVDSGLELVVENHRHVVVVRAKRVRPAPQVSMFQVAEALEKGNDDSNG